MVLYGFVLWGLSLLGLRLPIDLPWWLAVVLQVGVVWFIWKGWKAARRAPGNHLRLFNAQESWANAFALQALILFLW
jgi:arginine exporter protein ArgO